jgi:hypothetical protein
LSFVYYYCVFFPVVCPLKNCLERTENWTEEGRGGERERGEERGERGRGGGGNNQRLCFPVPCLTGPQIFKIVHFSLVMVKLSRPMRECLLFE